MTDKAYMSDRIWCALPHILPQACQKRADDGAGLSAARDGRADLETIIRGAPAFLAPGGLLALETGIAQHAALTAFAAPLGYTGIESKRDLTDRERFLLLRR